MSSNLQVTFRADVQKERFEVCWYDRSGGTEFLVDTSYIERHACTACDPHGLSSFPYNAGHELELWELDSHQTQGVIADARYSRCCLRLTGVLFCRLIRDCSLTCPKSLVVFWVLVLGSASDAPFISRKLLSRSLPSSCTC
jgi:hypothetical protein